MNVIFNDFLKNYLSGFLAVDGSEAPKFKIALLNKGYKGDATDRDKFDRLQLYGYEVAEKVNGTSTGYKKGGMSLSFTKDSSDKDSIIYYKSNPSIFTWRKEGSGYADFSVASAIIYVCDETSKYNGMLVSWYDFGGNVEVVADNSFTLKWDRILTITPQNSVGGAGSSSIAVDSELSSTSTNPVQNRVITELIKKLGVFTQDELGNLLDKKNPDGITDFIEDSTEEEFKGIDTVERVENSSIDNMFI